MRIGVCQGPRGHRRAPDILNTLLSVYRKGRGAQKPAQRKAESRGLALWRGSGPACGPAETQKGGVISRETRPVVVGSLV